MNDIWAIANDHGEWTIAVGDVITFLDSVAYSDRLVRRAGTIPAMLPGKAETVTPEQVAAVDDLIRHNEGLTLELL